MSQFITEAEVPMVFGNVTLTPQKEVVRKFYKDMWDHANIKLIPEIFHEDFTFRGSLGPILVGHSQFAEYVVWITESLENYTCDILDMVEEKNKVFGKLVFQGLHRKPLFGCGPTGQHVSWYGAPVFTFEKGKVRDLWVLGDIYGLIGRMKNGKIEQPEFALAS